jgi:hypothetical protein
VGIVENLITRTSDTLKDVGKGDNIWLYGQSYKIAYDGKYYLRGTFVDNDWILHRINIFENRMEIAARFGHIDDNPYLRFPDFNRLKDLKTFVNYIIVLINEDIRKKC